MNMGGGEEKKSKMSKIWNLHPSVFVSRFHGIFGVLYFIFKGRELQGMVDVYLC